MRRTPVIFIALLGGVFLVRSTPVNIPTFNVGNGQSGVSSSALPSANANPSAEVSAETSPIAQPRSFRVVSSGDFLLHERLWNQAKKDGNSSSWDFFPQLAAIEPLIKSADLALCHLETPLAKVGGPYSGYPIFNSPPQIVPAIKKLGYDMCDQTSNHTFDAGAAGIKRTLDYLDEAQIKHTGSYRTQEESTKVLVIPVSTPTGEVKVGIIAYTYGFNGLDYPGGDKWRANEIDVKQILAEAKACRDAGAEVVIAKIHWGSEYTNYPNDFQTNLASTLAESGLIDLIDGDHTHSVQPIQQIGKMWVIYSHGNLVAAQREPETVKSEGVITRWTFTEDAQGNFSITKAEFAPTLITDDFPVRVLVVNTALTTDTWVSTTKKRLQKALSRTTKTIESMNANVSLISD
ncbi:MAG: CapA family protein [Actinobacteria bacterium]|uniref:Unannotated protein n=1 Tax=freshwater metagenome TaxID=449393 RepID=A0A6J5YNP3_9ZZZZ|nr:CapA family protein [Actinomycetota bacterium]